MYRKTSRPYYSLSMAALMLPVISSFSALSYAQQGEVSTTLEEVVVTARKRAESLQDTPVAVSAFGSEDMRAAQINNIADLAQQVPGLTNKDGARVSGLTIRGVGARAVGARVDPGVGVYVDGIFIPRSDTQLVDVVDMEAIQVLRGPQGTLFGKNTAGGAVLMNTQKPGAEFEGHIDATVGDWDKREISVRVGGPLIGEALLGALTYDSREADGYMDDAITGRDYGDTDRQAVVGQLRYVATDSLTIDLIALWGKREESAAPATCNFFNPNAQLAQFASPTMDGTFEEACNASEAMAKGEKVIMDSRGMDFEVTNKMAGMTVDWDLDTVSIKSVTGYLYQDDLSRDDDPDGTAYLSIGNFSEISRQLNGNGLDGDGEDREFISQEFNLFGSLLDDDLEYTLGVYASDESINDQVGGNALALGGWVGLPVVNSTDVTTLPPSLAGLRGMDLTSLSSQSAAAFGQFIYSLNDMWQFTLGGRYTWEEKKIDMKNYVSTDTGFDTLTRTQFDALADDILDFVPNPNFPKTKDDESWTQFTPSATVTMFAPETWTGGFLNSGMFYLTYSEGFKAGGFSAFGLDEPTIFDPEEVANTELGFKLDMWDQRFRLNGAVYHMDYDDMQLGVTRTYAAFDTEFGITNAGKAELQGVELELVLLPISGLYISLTGSYIDASYDEFVDAYVDGAGNQISTDRADEDFAYVPEQTYSWVIQYDWDTEPVLITPRVSGFYKDEIYLGQDPVSWDFKDDSTLDDYTVWNARLAFSPHAVEGLEVSLYVDNLTNEFYYGSGTVNAGNIGAVSGIRGKPRNYGMQVYYSW